MKRGGKDKYQTSFHLILLGKSCCHLDRLQLQYFLMKIIQMRILILTWYKQKNKANAGMIIYNPMILATQTLQLSHLPENACQVME